MFRPNCLSSSNSPISFPIPSCHFKTNYDDLSTFESHNLHVSPSLRWNVLLNYHIHWSSEVNFNLLVLLCQRVQSRFLLKLVSVLGPCAWLDALCWTNTCVIQRYQTVECRLNELCNDKSFVIIYPIQHLNHLLLLMWSALGRKSKPKTVWVLLRQFSGYETSAATLCHEYFSDSVLSSEVSLWQHSNHHPRS